MRARSSVSTGMSRILHKTERGLDQRTCLKILFTERKLFCGLYAVILDLVEKEKVHWLF